ncbi:MAG: hypothetical protein QG567_1964 [Campylobacterota bacterium]|nr:hypothetical protein [Campylobacterota bacterium]
MAAIEPVTKNGKTCYVGVVEFDDCSEVMDNYDGFIVCERYGVKNKDDVLKKLYGDGLIERGERVALENCDYLNFTGVPAGKSAMMDLALVPNELKTQELCLKAVRDYSCSLEDVPTELRSAEIWAAAIQLDSRYSMAVPKEMKSMVADALNTKKEDGSMRENIRFFHNTDEQTVHFISGKLGLDIGFDLWIKLDNQKSLFENLEYILKGAGIAHNLTSIEQIHSQEGSSVVTIEATYNKVLSEEAKSVASLAVECKIPDKDIAVELASLAGSNSSQNLNQ